ncbi:MAG: hypothetical protein QM770_23505 [Tepidisphaeraceae bacterium]
MITRRDVLAGLGQSVLLASMASLARADRPATAPAQRQAMRCINIVNFLRGSEPRSPIDLLEPAREQMKLIAERKLPATWLLQFDALVAGPFVPFLKQSMPADHEVGFWFEMNRAHCEAANVEWRGRPGLTWDSHPSVAFTIGYTPDERRKLADAAMSRFRDLFGAYPRSIASWNLDSITLAHLSEHYGLDAAAVCRDQIATDGFTIWARRSPATTRANATAGARPPIARNSCPCRSSACSDKTRSTTTRTSFRSLKAA